MTALSEFLSRSTGERKKVGEIFRFDCDRVRNLFDLKRSMRANDGAERLKCEIAMGQKNESTQSWNARSTVCI